MKTQWVQGTIRSAHTVYSLMLLIPQGVWLITQMFQELGGFHFHVVEITWQGCLEKVSQAPFKLHPTSLWLYYHSLDIDILVTEHLLIQETKYVDMRASTLQNKVRVLMNLSFEIFVLAYFPIWIFSFLEVVGIELRVLCLPGKCSTTWPRPHTFCF
jgi:hypothetical protein